MDFSIYKQQVNPEDLKAYSSEPGIFKTSRVGENITIVEGWVSYSGDARSAQESNLQAQLKTESGFKGNDFHATHIIPYCLGGRGMDNLFIAPQKVNQSYLSALERQIIDFAKLSPDTGVYLKATLEWGEGRYIPERISYEAYMQAGSGSLVSVHSSSQKVGWKHDIDRDKEKHLTLKEQLDASQTGLNTKQWVESTQWNGMIQ